MTGMIGPLRHQRLVIDLAVRGDRQLGHQSRCHAAA